MTRPSVFAELSEDLSRICVWFVFTPARHNAIKSIPGRIFVPVEKGGPYWALPLDLVTARTLRQKLPEMQLGNALKAWGREEVRKERNLRALAVVDDVPLKSMKVYKKLPKLAKTLRPYQRADIKFIAETNVINGNEPRLGKTREAISAAYEADLEHGAHLVIALKTSLEDPWRKELEAWQPLPVFTLSGETKKAERDSLPEWIMEALGTAKGFWLVTTANMLRNGELDWSFEEGDDWIWNTVTIDEFRKTGLSNLGSKFHRSAMKLRSSRRIAMSGTPMGGVPINLFGPLKWLEPNVYTSKWRWADQWLEIEEVYIGAGRRAKQIGGIKKGREDQFYAALAPHMLRRLREEVLPQLPKKQYVEIWCDMTPKQRKQYDQFALDAELRIDEMRLKAAGVLAEYQRLKVFAGAYCDRMTEDMVPCWKCDGSGNIKEGDVSQPCPRCSGSGVWSVMHPKPTADSGKLQPMLDRLAEAGIEAEEPSGDTQAVITSQFKEIADMVHAHLNQIGISAEKMTGDTSNKERLRIRQAFQAGEGPRVLVMTTGTGGLAIELNRASDIHILDETWDPDDQEQVEDRLIDTTKHHQVTCFYYRSKNSIEEYIYETTQGKAVTNKEILDMRRHGFRATHAAKG